MFTSVVFLFHCYGETMEQIYTNLEKDGSEWAITQLNTLKKMVSEGIYFLFI